MSEALSTTDHDAIRHWVEERRGKPSRVKASAGEDGEGVLRIDFGKPEPALEPISWDEFFQTFDDRDLTFLYQEENAKREKSYFCKFVRKEDKQHAFSSA